MKVFTITTILLFCTFFSLNAQIKLNAILGGGQYNMKQFENSPTETRIDPGLKLQAGILASTKFRKDGMLSIETGALFTYTVFKSFFLDIEASNNTSDGSIIWDQNNPNVVRSYYLNIPLTFDFNVYERFGVLIGGHLNARISKKEEN